MGVLVDHERSSSAYALARPACEASLRGAWLAIMATDQEIAKLDAGRESVLPLMGGLLQAFEQHYGQQLGRKLSSVMDSLTHGGLRAIAAHASPADARAVQDAAILASASMAVGLATSSLAHHFGMTETSLAIDACLSNAARTA